MDYYEGAHRVTRGGVPMRVFHKGIPPEQRKEINFAAQAGLSLTLEDAPSFSFEPDGDLLAKATAYRAKYAPPPAPTNTDYYAGGVRRIIKGVPCRLARIGKDTRHLSDNKDLTVPTYRWEKRAASFREELVCKGRYEAAGVLRPAIQPEFRRAA